MCNLPMMRQGLRCGLILLGSLSFSCSLIVNNKLDEPRADGTVAPDSRTVDQRTRPDDSGVRPDQTRPTEVSTPPPPRELCSDQPRVVAEELAMPPSPESFALRVDSEGTPHIIYVERDHSVVHKWWDPDAQDWRFQTDVTHGVPADRVALAITDKDQLHLFYRERDNHQLISALNKRPGVLSDKWADQWSDSTTATLDFPVASLDAAVFTTGLAQNSSSAFLSLAGEGHAYVRFKIKLLGSSTSYDICPTSDMAADHTRIAVAEDQPLFVSSRFEEGSSHFRFEAGTWLENQECPSVMLDSLQPAAENNLTAMPRPAAVVIRDSAIAHIAYARDVPTATGITDSRLMHAAWQISGKFYQEQVPFEHSVGPLSPALALGANNQLLALFTRVGSAAAPSGELHGARFDPSSDPPWQISPLIDPVGEANRLALDPQGRLHMVYETMPDLTSADPRIELHHLCRASLP